MDHKWSVILTYLAPLNNYFSGGSHEEKDGSSKWVDPCLEEWLLSVEEPSSEQKDAIVY